MLEPDSCGRGIIPWRGQYALYTMSWPYSMIAAMITAFYWMETMDRLSGRVGLSKDMMVSLKRMKIPAIIISVLLILIDHINGALRVCDFESRIH